MARKTVSDDFKIFSKRLSELMKERHITQDTLATTIGVKRQTVSLYKSGQSMPDAEVLRDIAVFFGVSSDWLLGLTGVRMPNTDVQAICARTGLSETAVSGLMDMKQFAEREKENRKLAELALLSHLIELECTLPYLGTALQYVSATFEDGNMPVSMDYKDDDGYPFGLSMTANGFLDILRQSALNDIGKSLDSIRNSHQRIWGEQKAKGEGEIKQSEDLQ